MHDGEQPTSTSVEIFVTGIKSSVCANRWVRDFKCLCVARVLRTTFKSN